MPNFDTFIFQDYQFNPKKKLLTLSYSFDDKVHFEEIIEFNFPFDSYNKEELDHACFGLFMMAGISYYKASLPKNIEIRKGRLDAWQKNFFKNIYTQGLGEFLYQNKLHPKDIADFPTGEDMLPNLCGLVRNETTYSGAIIPLGGGKDSLTTIEILKKSPLPPSSEQAEALHTVTVGHEKQMKDQVKAIGLPHLKVKRTICPNLIKLNKEGALNGHVPISAIWAFIFMVTAVLTQKKYIILSNEASANEGNIKIDGVEINHQYSKSLEFEKLMQEYVQREISGDIIYFSFLRPYSELKIAELFTKNCFKKYQHLFSSCNKNFVQTNKKPFTWCCACPKCAFVFLILTPYIKRETLLETFGENLLTNPDLKDVFEELLGLKGQKPFECVGTIEECRAAAQLSLQIDRDTGLQKWPELEKFHIPKIECDNDEIPNHLIPELFQKLLP